LVKDTNAPITVIRAVNATTPCVILFGSIDARIDTAPLKIVNPMAKPIIPAELPAKSPPLVHL
jgi:hypothetical protein